ncbi:hypothetical protein HYD99_02975 [Mycoplasmopsis bovis]|nr:hypothetical protein [Mycoplasmopsis bovis]QQH28996.1 hypothetical protein HYD99_02975 [Mycoplasmopsis bovis]
MATSSNNIMIGELELNNQIDNVISEIIKILEEKVMYQPDHIKEYSPFYNYNSRQID